MRKKLLTGWIVVVVALTACRNETGTRVLRGGKSYQNETGTRVLRGGKSYQNETKSKQRITLPDSSTVILAPGGKIELGSGFDSGNKQVSLDGEAWFDLTGGTLHTRDLVVDVLWAGKFHVEAYRARPGEEIDVLDGRLRAKKSYPSDTDNEAEVLAAGEMVMINRDIDLMEKEKLNAAEMEKLKGGW